MPHNRPLILKVADRKDFLVPGLLVSVLILVSALLSAQPVPMTAFVIAFLVAGWTIFTVGLTKTNNMKLTASICMDSSIEIKSDQETKTEGVLGGHQWCNRQFAVLRYISAGKRHNLVILSEQQDVDDYRRLLVWLRQDFVIQGHHH